MKKLCVRQSHHPPALGWQFPGPAMAKTIAEFAAASQTAVAHLQSLTRDCHVLNRRQWPDKVILGMGGNAVVYRIFGLALKLGRVTPPEADYQRLFAARGLALPVLAYHPELDCLPEPLTREVCPRHGVRREIMPDPAPCRCAEPPAALVMPLTDAHATIEPDDLRAFIMGFSREAEQAGLCWDARPANVARYRGRLVALDFGEPS